MSNLKDISQVSPLTGSWLHARTRLTPFEISSSRGGLKIRLLLVRVAANREHADAESNRRTPIDMVVKHIQRILKRKVLPRTLSAPAVDYHRRMSM
jgi:hypothetical protein